MRKTVVCLCMLMAFGLGACGKYAADAEGSQSSFGQDTVSDTQRTNGENRMKPSAGNYLYGTVPDELEYTFAYEEHKEKLTKEAWNTWCTFRYCLDYFRYFLPMSGSYTTDGEAMAEMVRLSGHGPEDFFIFSASGTKDFAYSAFKSQIMAMGEVPDGTFQFADNGTDGNLLFLEREGYSHDAAACDEYTYNGLCFFWNGGGTIYEKP